MQVPIVIISEDYAQSLIGVEFTESQYFNPVQLSDGRWFISPIEAEYIDDEEIIEEINYSFD